MTIAASLGGCASTAESPVYQKAQTYVVSTAQVVGEKTVETGKVVKEKALDIEQRMQKYLAEKDLLKTFHDSAPLAEDQLLSVLHHAGAGGKPSATTPPERKTPPKSSKLPPPAQSKSPEGQPLPEVQGRYAGNFRWPLDAGIVSSEYGARWGKIHKGIDIAADTGEPVHAVADGVVIYASDGMRGYGNVVIVRHDEKFTSLYAHNSALKCHQGDKVSQGTVIALLGSTGHSTGPHTHFEIRNGDAPVDPRTVLPKASRF